MPDSELILLLSRGQFALTIGMHIVLAAFSLGLAQWLVLTEAMWLLTKNPRWFTAYRFWLKIFVMTVAVGAVSGVVMEFQFGSNWGPLSQKAGGILGPLMFFEVLVAFFLESALTGVMFFGLNRIGPKTHFVVTCCVAIGALISAVWILAANSWMQTPVGFITDAAGRFHPTDWLTILRAPSFPWRLAHMVLAAFIGTAFMVIGVGAWRLLHHPQSASARLMVSVSLWLALVMLPVQIVVGDLHGENTLKHQPQKVAAMEGDWHRPPPGEGEPMRLFAIPLQDEQRNLAEIAIPDVASLYLRHNLSGQIKSLSEFPPQDIPPVAIVFFAFRAMVGLGIAMLGLAVAGLVLRLRKSLWRSRRFLTLAVLMSPAGFIAMLAGWVVTEVGRQPWTIWGVLRTEESVSNLPLSLVTGSFIAIGITYAIAFALGLFYLFRYTVTFSAKEASEPWRI